VLVSGPLCTNKERGDHGSLARVIHGHLIPRTRENPTAIPKDTKFEGDIIVKLKKVLTLLAFLFPIGLIIGILVSFIYSLNYHEDPHVDWLVALSLAVIFSLFFTWYNRRELKGEQKTS